MAVAFLTEILLVVFVGDKRGDEEAVTFAGEIAAMRFRWIWNFLSNGNLASAIGRSTSQAYTNAATVIHG